MYFQVPLMGPSGAQCCYLSSHGIQNEKQKILMHTYNPNASLAFTQRIFRNFLSEYL